MSRFSGRVPASLEPNALARALEAMRRADRPILDLTESNPTRAGFDYPHDLLASLGDSRGLIYRPDPLGLPEARRAVAGDYRRRGIDVDPDRIVLTASTSEAYSLLFKVLCDPGDEVLVPRPSYPLFEHLTALDAVAAVPYRLEYDGSWVLDVAALERVWTPRTRAVLVVTPNNPTGTYATGDELDGVAALCRSRNAALIADEVFADYELAPIEGRRPGRVLEPRGAVTFSLGGLSKSAGLPQVKLAWIAMAGPEPQLSALRARLELASDTYLSVSTPVQAAAPELLARGRAIACQIHERVRSNRRALLARSTTTPACTVQPAEGGWYSVVRVPAVVPEEQLVLDLLADDGVLTHPGYFFDFPDEAYLVVSLLPPPQVFATGVDRVLRHFDCSAFRA
jgi:aspartate/methionine/tyrosine aminotransferase